MSRPICPPGHHIGYFEGPLGNHINYIENIALPNCKDYFDLVKRHKESCEKSSSWDIKRLRYFLNAIESLNNIPEYFIHDKKEQRGWDSGQLADVLGGIRTNHKLLRDIELIANAYKHCVRYNPKDLHAGDLQSPFLSVVVSSPDDKGVDVYFKFSSIECERFMEEAFGFWVKYSWNPHQCDLLDFIDK